MTAAWGITATFTVACLAAACGGQTGRDHGGTHTGDPIGAAGTAGNATVDALAGAAGAGNAAGAAGESSVGGSAGIDWSRIDWDPAGGQSSVVPDCDSLARYDAGVRISDSPAAQVLFSDALDRVVLRVEDALQVIALPTGGTTEIPEPGVTSIAWVGEASEQVLAAHGSRDRAIVPLDGGPAAVIGSDVCGHVVTPDRSRVYVFTERTTDRSPYVYEMRLGSVSTGQSRVVYVQEHESFPIVMLESEFVPDGSGLLVLDDLAQLLFIPAAGDAVVLGAGVESYEVDLSGCVVAVVTGEPDVGTTLIRLPR